jgi:phospholipid/cholesterol/gamma-HCH transport system substrate-binding protein
MENRSIEAAVGIFVILGMICVGYLTIKLGKMQVLGDNTYTLNARFESVSGLKPGSYVEMAGVPVGQVDSIKLDNKEQMAMVKLKINKDVILKDDVIASISTAGLIGDKYVKLTPGGADEDLKPGGTITETESAVDIEALISKYVFGGVDK